MGRPCLMWNRCLALAALWGLSAACDNQPPTDALSVSGRELQGISRVVKLADTDFMPRLAPGCPLPIKPAPIDLRASQFDLDQSPIRPVPGVFINDELFWTHRFGLLRGHLDGTAPEVIIKGLRGLGQLQAQGDSLFFTLSDRMGLFTAPRSGEPYRQILPDNIAAYAVGDDAILFAVPLHVGNENQMRVYREDRLKASFPELLFTRGVISNFTGDQAGNVFWTEEDKNNTTTLWKLSHNTQEPVKIFGAPKEKGTLEQLFVDSNHVYWFSRSQILKLPKEGGDVEVFVQGRFDIASVALDEDHVYWSETDSIFSHGARDFRGVMAKRKDGNKIIEIVSKDLPSLTYRLIPTKAALYLTTALDGTSWVPNWWTQCESNASGKPTIESVLTAADRNAPTFSSPPERLSLPGQPPSDTHSALAANHLATSPFVLSGNVLSKVVAGTRHEIAWNISLAAANAKGVVWFEPSPTPRLNYVATNSPLHINLLDCTGITIKSLAVDDTHVYWAEGELPTRISRVPIQGGSKTELLQDVATFLDKMVVDHNLLIFAFAGRSRDKFEGRLVASIWAMPSKGGPPKAITPLLPMDGFDVSDGYVTWVERFWSDTDQRRVLNGVKLDF
jgi:hypothetical protein